VSNKSKKLFLLEDSESRINWFRNRCKAAGHILVLADNVKDALHILRVEKFDMIFLDHDLDDRVYVDSNEENTGYQVAKELHNTINRDTEVVIHSMNSIGSKNMYNEIISNGNKNVNQLIFGTFSI